MKAFILDNNSDSSPRDPSIVYHDGYFYHCFSFGGSLCIKRNKVLEELNNTPKTIVYTPKAPISQEIWAPELHIIDNKCYIYVAIDDGDNYHHRMYVLSNDSSDPLTPYTKMVQIKDETNRWAIDGTVLKYNGELYFVWSGWERDSNVCQNLYIAHMSDPMTIDGERHMISTPEYDWEKMDCQGLENIEPFINEGPFAFYTDKSIYIIYSGSGCWGDNYCLGALKFLGGDILDKSNWYKHPHSIFHRVEGVKAPGHASFIQNSPDGKIYMAYHAYNGDPDSGLNHTYAAIQEVYIEDDFPVLGEPVHFKLKK